MRGKKDAKLKDECVRLRLEERLSLREIHQRTGAPKGSLSAWLRKHPLTDAEQRTKKANARRGPSRKKQRGTDSQAWLSAEKPITPERKTRIAEAAVMFRAALHGIPIYGSPFEGDKADWVMGRRSGHLVRIQVKCTGSHNSINGLPTVSLQCSSGRNRFRRYLEGEFDFLVGYDLRTDIAYVWSAGEISTNHRTVTICPGAAERWDKIIGG